MGVVGCGRWGRNLVRNFETLGALGAVCEPDPEAQAACLDPRPGIPAFPDLAALAASGEVDAVAIATPAETHAGLADEALSAGLHVLVEKPTTTGLASARALAAKAGAAGLRLMTGHLLLYHPAFRELLSVVREGRIGEPRYVAASRIAAVDGKVREDAVWEFAPHDVAMLLALAETLPSEASCVSSDDEEGRSEHARAELAFPGGLQGHLVAAWRGSGKEQRLVVQGSEGTIVFDDVADRERKLVIGSGGPESLEPVPFGDEEPLASECEAFLEAVRTGEEPPSGASESLEVMTVLDACFRSRAEGAPVALVPEPQA